MGAVLIAMFAIFAGPGLVLFSTILQVLRTHRSAWEAAGGARWSTSFSWRPLSCLWPVHITSSRNRG